MEERRKNQMECASKELERIEVYFFGKDVSTQLLSITAM